ncbi:leucyl aminopeptidase [Candidatus Uhrbacteria bacterium]|nr:leucyl aminopeptidase [Candidatus Uhrbacteria bacterium]
MKIELKPTTSLGEATDVLCVPCFKGESTARLSDLDKELHGMLKTMMKSESFDGSSGQWAVFPILGQAKMKRVALIGLGDKGVFKLDDVRKLTAQLVRRARDVKAKRASILFPSTTMTGRELGSAIAEGALLGAYQFHTYKGKLHEEKKKDLETLVLLNPDAAKRTSMESGIQEGSALARATIFARDLVNTPAMDMTPKQLADAAKQCATRGSGISVKYMDQQVMERMGMRGALAVARGSVHPPVGVHLMYHPKKRAKKKIAIVGKAVTFDSGGLSLKPADGMMTMKIDMAGAATVIGLFQALSLIAPNVEVHGIFLAVENMPSGSAYRPGDVVKAMNGVAIEVLNTDAEGRVTLADALTYAERLKPDAIIDLATLTGACVVALGEDIAGYMGNDRKLLDRLGGAAKEAGEEMWELPLHQPYKELIKSKIGDIKNIGGGKWGGAITAGLFLSHFVGKTPWVHIDIAGPSYVEKETRPDLPYGGTGFGVRTLVRYLQGLG